MISTFARNICRKISATERIVSRSSRALLRRPSTVVREVSSNAKWLCRAPPASELGNQYLHSKSASPYFGKISTINNVAQREVWATNNLSTRSFSSSNQVLDEDDDDSGPVEIANEGQEITINLSENNEAWTFSAPLLWVNDPNYIHPSSGQRMRTLGQYSKQNEIVQGQILHVSEQDDIWESLHPPPLPGSLHPRGGIYSFTNQATADHDDKQQRTLLQVEWNTGEHSYFDQSWLVEQAKAERLGQASAAFAESVEFQATQTTERKSFRQFKIAHVGEYKPPSTISNDTRVTRDIAVRARTENDNDIASTIPTFHYDSVMENEDGLFEAMQGIFEHGAILIRNSPIPEEDASLEQQESIVSNLGKKFSGGKLSHGSLYGDIFHVQSKAGAENIAYTNVGLPPHQDLTYYESKPFLQLLHCVNNGNDTDSRIIGGESVLIDAMAAAEELRSWRSFLPELFDTLCQAETTFIKEREGADMVSPKPHIVTDPTHGHVVEVNWSPPFEGPFQIHPQISVDTYIRAYRAMETMLNDQRETSDSENPYHSFLDYDLEQRFKRYAREFTWEYALEPGDILVFNNQRMLHGRREFSAVGNAERHLIGCYTDAMDTTSQYRQLLRERGGTSGGGYGKRNPGSGCRWI